MPYSTLTRDCINSWRLTRFPASSNAFVVVASCPCPISPIRRSRRSRRSSNMKMTIAATSPAVLSGPTTGPSHAKRRKSRRRVGRHDNGPQHGSFRRLRSQVSLDALQRFLQLLDRASPARKAHVGNLRSDVGTIAGQVLDEMVYLPRQAPTREAESREHQGDREQHRRNATDPPLEPGDGWRQDERQKDRERERHEDGLCPVQNGDDEHAAGERHPGLHGFQGVVQVPTPFLGRIAADRPTVAVSVSRDARVNLSHVFAGQNVGVSRRATKEY